MRRVSILGCGWLGFPLAQKLKAQGYTVKGSTTTVSKIPVLQKAGIFSFCLNVSDKITGEGVSDFFDTDILVITLPFKRAFTDPNEYAKQIDSVIKQARNIKFIIFTSSTSVYPDNAGTVTESTVFQLDDERGQVLFNIEQVLLKQSQASIVRLAGLYGGTRKIGKFLSGKKDLEHGDRFVNLIHLDDAVGIISLLIEKSKSGEIFNAVSDGHPTRQKLYTAAAKKAGLPTPLFLKSNEGKGKIVSNEKIKQLGYKFLHPDPLLD